METWYKITRWCRRLEDIVSRQVTRSTEKTVWYLVGTAERRELISSTYYRWFKSYDDAIAEINRRQNADSEKDSKKRLSEAAPQLLEALEEIVKYTERYPNDMGLEDFAKSVAKAAIKSAKGE